MQDAGHNPQPWEIDAVNLDKGQIEIIDVLFGSWITYHKLKNFPPPELSRWPLSETAGSLRHFRWL